MNGEQNESYYQADGVQYFAICLDPCSECGNFSLFLLDIMLSCQIPAVLMKPEPVNNVCSTVA